MVYRQKPSPTVTRLTGAAGVNQDAQSAYWEGSSAAEPASTTASWTSHIRVPTVSSSNDPRGVFTPIAGGIQINFPGTYEVEVTGHIQGSASGVREGIQIYTTGDIIPLVNPGGTPMGGHLIYNNGTGSARYFTTKAIVTVVTGGAQVKFQDYVQTATSHTCTLTRVRATKIVQGGPGPQGEEGPVGPVGPDGTRWGYTNTWAFADSTDIPCDMFDGEEPRVGDLLLSLNGFSVGEVYIVTAVYPSGNVDVSYNSPGINIKGPQGTRWGTVNVSFAGAAGAELAGVATTFPDGGLPRAGDIVQNLHGDHLGDVYFIKEVVYGVNSATIKKFSPVMNIRGATGPAGSALSHWPVDSVYISFVNTNPAAMFGGTWVSVGSGRMLIGVDSADAAMDAAGDTGGDKTVTLGVANLPPHTHSINHDHSNATTNNAGGHDHTITRKLDVGSGTGVRRGATASDTDDAVTGNAGSHSHTVNIPSYSGNSGSGSGTSTPVNNLPPYLAVYMWRRTA